jgi:segregation and condensation protein B
MASPDEILSEAPTPDAPEAVEAAPAAVEGEPEAVEEAPPVEAADDDYILPDDLASDAPNVEDSKLKATLEAIIYISEEPLTLDQIVAAIEQPRERVAAILEQLSADYEREDRGLVIREIAGGLRMTTKPEHHEAVRRFVRNLNPPLKLSLPALETLAVIAYKQPITAPEIMEIRGVQGAGVLKTLLDRKLIGTAGRKNVVGKPILYKTTKEFLVQFGLRDLAELPTLKEFQEIGRMDTEGTTEPPVETPERPDPLPPMEEPKPDEPSPEEPPVLEPGILEPIEEPVETPDDLPPGEPQESQAT